MQPRVDFISLGVRSVAASRRFYVDALGWPVHREVPDEVVFIQANHGLVLSLKNGSPMQDTQTLLAHLAEESEERELRETATAVHRALKKKASTR